MSELGRLVWEWQVSLAFQINASGLYENDLRGAEFKAKRWIKWVRGKTWS